MQNTIYVDRGLAMVTTRTLVGMTAAPVRVEVHLANGLPCFNIVGLAEAAVKESKERVRAAIVNAGFDFPAKRITVNLAPADLPKSGSQFDLPIAIGVLLASSQIVYTGDTHYEFYGELALDSRLSPVRGLLPSILACQPAKHVAIIPYQNQTEAALIDNVDIYLANDLLEVCKHLMGQKQLDVVEAADVTIEPSMNFDLAQVFGQQRAKRALEIAAAGRHNMLMMGPPGAGKSMLAHRLPSILPALSREDALEAAAVSSIVGIPLSADTIYQTRVRSPHHSCSSVALVGGGSTPRPGEVSLAHKGVLFLDEINEFSRQALEQLREPLEVGYINIARATQTVQFPADCQLIAACNPCKCGFYGDESQRCQCSASSIDSYRSKLSGPLMDRIDIHLNIPPVSLRDISQAELREEPSSSVLSRVTSARKRQMNRQGVLNSQLANSDLRKHVILETADQEFLINACEKLHISARGYNKIEKLAMTIADLDNANTISRSQLSEAISYRQLDRTNISPF